VILINDRAAHFQRAPIKPSLVVGPDKNIPSGSKILGTASSVQNLKEIQIEQIARNN
jgi:hypothetical protein